MLVVFDHRYKAWDEKRTKVNGAYTYSMDIEKFYLPHIKNLGKRTIVSTAPPFNFCDYEAPLDDCELAVQFFHKYPYLETDKSYMVEKVLNWLKIRGFGGKLVIVTSYKSFADYLTIKYPQITTVFFNMVVDVTDLPIKKEDARHRGIWFGNSYSKKDTYKKNICSEFNRNNYPLDLIQDGHYNYNPLSSDPHEILSHYTWGVGVGRCALEMLAIGLNVMVSGEHFGGIVSSYDDLFTQSNTNFNGRQITYDRDMFVCANKLINTTESLINPQVVRQVINEWINQNIKKIYENF
jgi:hypothetical protein